MNEQKCFLVVFSIIPPLRASPPRPEVWARAALSTPGWAMGCCSGWAALSGEEPGLGCEGGPERGAHGAAGSAEGFFMRGAVPATHEARSVRFDRELDVGYDSDGTGSRVEEVTVLAHGKQLPLQLSHQSTAVHAHTNRVGACVCAISLRAIRKNTQNE